MKIEKAEAVICGAGIAGIAAAYFLTVRHGMKDVVIVDERAPLSFTSDKSTEAYRNWWPGPGSTMIRFMDRSIDLLEELAEESNNVFRLNRRGYVYLTATDSGTARLRSGAETISKLGAGILRPHPGECYRPHSPEEFANQPVGADLLLGNALIRQQFPFLSENVQAALHARRCGWLSAQQLGIYLLDQAKSAGARFRSGRVHSITIRAGRVEAVHVGDETIHTTVFVNAAGPYLRHVAALVGQDLPVFNELHGKISFSDVQGIVPRDAPMMIWDEPVSLPWSEEEQEELESFEDTRWLLEPFPAGLHFRPEGSGASPILLMLWPYHTERMEPVWPPPSLDASFPEIVLRGLTRMIPALGCYLERMGRPYVDSGYYCKTPENRPLIGPLSSKGAYVIGALSGYGIMAAPAAGELLAAHVAGAQLPEYAPAFLLSRYEDLAYQEMLKTWGDSGQL